MTAPAKDQLRGQFIELTAEMQKRLSAARDFASNPGDEWLAKAELDAASQLINQAIDIVDQLKQQSQS